MPMTLLHSALRLPLQVLPDALHTAIVARALNHLLRGQRLAARLPELDGRSVCLDIRDAGSKLHFRIHGGRLMPAWPGPSQVTIRGELRDFIALATRTEDADTLFFHRRLSIEGDTETGLHVKNLLDALEFDWRAHIEAVAKPLAAFLPVRHPRPTR
jgi:predicted lipid carrier protein YhbT